MDESESKNEKPKEERRLDPELLKKELRCDLDQYDMLKRCSDKKDMTEWNEWREEHPDKNILLEGASLRGAFLEGANLEEAYLEGANLANARLCPEYHREGVTFLEDNEPKFANLRKAVLKGAYLQEAKLSGAHLENANLDSAFLQEAKLIYARLDCANLSHAHLERVVLEDACLKGTIIERAYLQRADFRAAIVDGSTTIWKPAINPCPNQSRDPMQSSDSQQPYNPKRSYTDFKGVALDSIRIDPRTKQLLEYNIRRNNWQQWYKWKDWYEAKPKERDQVTKALLLPVRFFWSISDYGLSTGRIIFTFFGLALIFANIYYNWGQIAPPGIVKYLFVDRSGVEVQPWLVPLRTLYFSIVTMTTLGFGDMYANAHSIWGHILLCVQVILGYVLLGALVTRFAILFTAGGPAGRFANEQEKKGQGE